jgi:hypothetical protein
LHSRLPPAAGFACVGAGRRRTAVAKHNRIYSLNITALSETLAALVPSLLLIEQVWMTREAGVSPNRDQQLTASADKHALLSSFDDEMLTVHRA